MSKSKRNGVIVAVVCILIGIAIALLGINTGRDQSLLREICTEQTDGVVVDIAEETDLNSDDEWETTYTPVFEYSAEGQTLTTRSPFDGSSAGFEIGEAVTVFYDPYDVTQYYVLEDQRPGTTAAVFTWVGAVLALLGLLGMIRVVRTKDQQPTKAKSNYSGQRGFCFVLNLEN